MYAAVRVISYTAEIVASWEKESGSVAKLWASNIVVEEYKYLGCMVNDRLNCARMAEERAKAGAKALSDWIRRCRAERRNVCETVGNVGRFGAVIWGRSVG